jgi:hypothetical protein
MTQPRSGLHSHDVYVATQTYTTMLPDGTPVIVSKGRDRARADHPLVTSNPQLWEPADLSVRFDTPDVEAATADPGERRTVVHRKPKGD